MIFHSDDYGKNYFAGRKALQYDMSRSGRQVANPPSCFADHLRVMCNHDETG